MSEITVSLIDTDRGGWRVFALESFGANVKRVFGKNETTVWATLKTPDGQITPLAIPNHPGAGPQPENTITMTDVQDLVRKVVLDLEMVLLEKQEEKKESGW